MHEKNNNNNNNIIFIIIASGCFCFVRVVAPSRATQPVFRHLETDRLPNNNGSQLFQSNTQLVTNGFCFVTDH